MLANFNQVGCRPAVIDRGNHGFIHDMRLRFDARVCRFKWKKWGKRRVKWENVLKAFAREFPRFNITYYGFKLEVHVCLPYVVVTNEYHEVMGVFPEKPNMRLKSKWEYKDGEWVRNH